METIKIQVTKDSKGGYTVTTNHLGGKDVSGYHPTHLSLAMVELRLNLNRFIKKTDSKNKDWGNLINNWDRINYDFIYSDPSHAPKTVNSSKLTFY